MVMLGENVLLKLFSFQLSLLSVELTLVWSTGYWLLVALYPALTNGRCKGARGEGWYDPHDTSRRSSQVAPKCPNQHLRLLRYAFQETKGEELAFETVAAKNESTSASKADSHGCRGQGCGDVPSGRDVN